VKRFIIVGPPGSKRKEIALQLSDYLSEDGSFISISVGDMLNKEISKKSDLGKQIVDARKNYQYVKDDVVVEIVKGQVDALEKENKSWIIEGFPRTRSQALAMQKMGIIPDKFILLNVDEESSIEKIKQNLLSEDNAMKYEDERVDEMAIRAHREYTLSI
jgi:adenylate kinase